MIRVLLVDDQALVRSGFRVILDSQPDIEVVGEAADGDQAVGLAAELAPDVICMDVEMPVMNGIDASRRILGDGAHAAAPAVLVLTTFGHEEYLFDALSAGVSGFLLKTSRAEQLIDAVRLLASGEALLGPDVTRAVMQRAATQAVEAKHTEAPGTDARAALKDQASVSHTNGRQVLEAAGLTERELDVLLLVAAGRSNSEIARELFLGAATVKTHVSNLLQKVGVRDRVQLVVWAHTHGILQG